MDEITTSDGPLRTEEEIQEELEQAIAEKKAMEEKKLAVLEDLAGKVTKLYAKRSAARRTKEESWLRAEGYYLGSLGNTGRSSNPDYPFSSSMAGKKRPDKNIVWTRCEIAKAQLVSMQFSGDEKHWTLLPPLNSPPDPTINDAIEKMDATMSDQMEACWYKREVTQSIEDMVVAGTGILKGPVNTGKTRKRYVRQQDEFGNIVWLPQITTEAVPEIKRVNYWYAFPDDTVTHFKDIGDMIEAHPMSRSDFIALRRNPAFSEFAASIEKAAALGPSNQSGDSMQSFVNLTDTNPGTFRDKFIVLEYHGPITRTELDVLEIEPPYEVPGDEYFGEVWVCNNTIIRIELENIEGCGKPPYSADVWQDDPASPFGFGLAEKLADAQRVVTQSWHMILDNASASSAPQVVINEEIIDPRNGEYELKPGKIWYSNSISDDVDKAFSFFQVPNVTEALFPIMQYAVQSAEEESGFSLSIGGLASPQVTSDTATGQALQQRAANVLLDQKSDSIDNHMIEPRIKALYDWNMQYNPDESIKKDLIVRVKSSTEYRNKEMYIRDLEKISVESANNPEMAKHLDQNALTRMRLSMMTLPTKNIVKPLEVVLQEDQKRAEEAANNPDPELIQQMIETKRLDIEERKVALEEQKLAFELQQNQQREAWEHEERMMTTYARVTEANSQLLKSQNEKEIALLTLAAKTENEKERTRLTAGIAVMNDETKKFLSAMEATQKAKDQLLTQREQDIKLKTGSGI